MQPPKERRFLDKEDYQSLVQSVTDYVVGINRNYQIIMANDLFRKEFGPRPYSFCYQTWKGRKTKCRDCLVEQSFKDGKVHAREETVIRQDGNPMRMLVKSTPVKGEEGEIAYVVETATDITERGNLQRELDRVEGKLREVVAGRLADLQKSETRYRTMFEYSQDAMLLTDRQGRIKEINQAAVEILGYGSKQEVIALTSGLELFEDPGDRRRFLDRIAAQGFVTEFEVRLTGKQGHHFDAQLTCSVILDADGGISGYMMIIRDITRLKDAQQEIEKRNVRLAILNTVAAKASSSLELKEVLDTTIDELLRVLEPDSVRIYLLNPGGDTLRLAANRGDSAKFISQSFMQHRRVGDGLLGQTVVACQTRVVDNLLRGDDPYVEAFLAEGLKSTVYIPLVAKGKPVGVLCVSSHTPYEFSAEYVEFLNAVGYQIGVAIDNANLYGSLQRAFEELKRAQEQVVRTEKLASLGKLAATIAHEINNPIAAVLTYARLMTKLIDRQRFTADRLPDIARYLNTVESETARCGEIVKNLLAFARQSSIKMEDHPIGKVLDRTLPLISHELEIRNIELVREIASGLPLVRCDLRQMQQALLNLLGNAAEAMPNGGTLTIRAGLSAQPGYLELQVSDTGSGIAQENLKAIFEPFFTTKEEGKGVGLGLSVVYGIVSRHSGSIEVESKPGKGSTFTLKLPVTHAPRGRRGCTAGNGGILT